MSQKALVLKNVTKTFYLKDKEIDTLKGRLFNIFKSNYSRSFHAVKDVNLEIEQGENFGIIGRNGSGKSTLVKLMSGAFVPDKGGEIIKNGTSMLLNLGVGMSHELTGRQNIYVSGSALGLKIKEIDKLFDQIVEFAELEKFINSKVKYYSSGMIQKLSFAIAINAGADIMFLDEVFAVGDAKFKKKAVEVMEKSWIDRRTIVMVSHSLVNIKKYCKRAVYLKSGQVEFVGDAREAIARYEEDNRL